VYDATDDSSVGALVASLIEQHGRLDVLMNCVGGVTWRPGGQRGTVAVLETANDIASLDPDYWDWQMKLNLYSAFYACRHAIPAMIKGGGGAIISIATGVAVDAHAGGHAQHQYAISKAGVVMMSRLIAGTYGTQGIRSNIIAPGATDSWATPALVEYAAA